MRKREGITEQVIVSGTPEEVRAEMKRMSRRSFAWGGIAAAIGYMGFEKLSSHDSKHPIATGFRTGLVTNEAVFRNLAGRRVEEHPLGSKVGSRQNGAYGLSGEIDPNEWRLSLTRQQGEPLLVSLDEIKALPTIEMVTELRCIEGWSQLMHWKGVRFSDFAQKYAPDQVSKPYVSIETPDRAYYVGLDTVSAMHPQTLLSYEMNGAPLEPGHGAPLRLTIPVKYGVKNIKRIGNVAFSDTQPRDYWAEQGYDWYCAL